MTAQRTARSGDNEITPRAPRPEVSMFGPASRCPVPSSSLGAGAPSAVGAHSPGPVSRKGGEPPPGGGPSAPLWTQATIDALAAAQRAAAAVGPRGTGTPAARRDGALPALSRPAGALGPTPAQPGLLGRALGWIPPAGRALAAGLLGAGLVANLLDLSPLPVTRDPDRDEVVLALRPLPGTRIPLLRLPALPPQPRPRISSRGPAYAAAHPNTPTAHREAIRLWLADQDAMIAARGLRRKPASQPIARFHAGDPPRGLAVLIHGFTAGARQWETYVDEIFAQGYDVLVPALPGHGLFEPDGRESLALLPGAAARDAWKEFEDELFAVCRPAGQVTIAGLSLGGMLALQLAERHAQARRADGAPVISRVIAVSPLVELTGDYKLAGRPLRLGPVGVTNQQVAESLAALASLLGAPVGRALEKLPVDMKHTDTPPIDDGPRWVNQDIVLGLSFNAAEMKAGKDALRALPGGVKLIVTEADQTVSWRAALALGAAVGAECHAFPASLAAPHALVSPLENTVPEAAARTRDLVVGWFAEPAARAPDRPAAATP